MTYFAIDFSSGRVPILVYLIILLHRSINYESRAGVHMICRMSRYHLAVPRDVPLLSAAYQTRRDSYT